MSNVVYPFKTKGPEMSQFVVERASGGRRALYVKRIGIWPEAYRGMVRLQWIAWLDK